MARRGEPPEGTLGAEIRHRRRGLGLSADDLAATLGTSRQVVLDWEWNVHVPGARYTERLNGTLGDPPVIVSLSSRPRSAEDAELERRVAQLEETMEEVERQLSVIAGRLPAGDGPRVRRGGR